MESTEADILPSILLARLRECNKKANCYSANTRIFLFGCFFFNTKWHYRKCQEEMVQSLKPDHFLRILALTGEDSFPMAHSTLHPQRELRTVILTNSSSRRQSHTQIGHECLCFVYSSATSFHHTEKQHVTIWSYPSLNNWHIPDSRPFLHVPSTITINSPPMSTLTEQ